MHSKGYIFPPKSSTTSKKQGQSFAKVDETTGKVEEILIDFNYSPEIGRFPLPPNTMLSFLVSKWPEQDYRVLRMSANIVFGGVGGHVQEKSIFFGLVSSILQ